MITLTALVALLGLGWGVQHLWKRAVRAAVTLAESKPVVASIAATKS